ncbi:hypothetical protein AVEN_89631-1 [Araneus ventricosus]|uniref:Uncharacterized protein n=1 Tax=Araneus ventricosus TaxID=182803 RepID=A0A4Y2NX61_ARAVE|nr:hypothetical protein AVEN_89631-1 [Araneus ventricosus]
MGVFLDYGHSKFPVAGKAKSWVLHHGKAPAHWPLLVSNYQSKYFILVYLQPTYFPDLRHVTFSSDAELRGTDSQVSKKCSDEGTREGGKSRIAICH